jgi:hypothetical protein
LRQILLVAFDAGALALQEIGDRAAEIAVGNVMR